MLNMKDKTLGHTKHPFHFDAEMDEHRVLDGDEYQLTVVVVKVLGLLF